MHRVGNGSCTKLTWPHFQKLVRGIDDTTPTNVVGQAKAQLSEKAVRAIKRLSGVPMPDFQSAFRGGRM